MAVRCLIQLTVAVFILVAGTAAAIAQECGNEIIEPPEDCDDGNTIAGDGCSPTCEFEGISGSILVLTGNGNSSVADAIASAGFDVVEGTLDPDQIHTRLSVANQIQQIWIWNDGSYGNTGVPADPARAFNQDDLDSLSSFSADHNHWIMDDLAWRAHNNQDQVNFSINEAIALSLAGGGIVLGTDDASSPSDAMVQHVNQVASFFGFETFQHVYNTSSSTLVAAGSFFTAPLSVTTTQILSTGSYAEVPNGPQPNGRTLLLAVFGQGSPWRSGVDPVLGGETIGGIEYENVNHVVTTTIPGAGIPGGCPVTPLSGCDIPTKSILKLKDKDGDGPGPKDKILWKFIKGPASLQSAFGDPTTSAGYKLCIYDGVGVLAIEANVAPGGVCGKPPCWKAIGQKGYKFKDKTASQDGTFNVILKGNATDPKTKIIIKGKNGLLTFSPSNPLLDASDTISVRLTNTANANCWGADFAPVSVIKNTDSLFKAKTP